MKVDLLVTNIGQLITLAGPPELRRGKAMRELTIIENAAIAVMDGCVAAVGRSADLCAAVQARETLDAGGRAVIPGFVDPHSHLPWAGHRAAEFEMRIGGAAYMQIMAAGGGIVRTVSDTWAASLEKIVAETRGRLDQMLAHGTTTAEAKAGYGLNVEDELKQLDAIAELQRAHLVDLVPTFLGAHAVPAEYRGHTDAYVDLVIGEMLPAVWSRCGYSQETGPSGHFPGIGPSFATFSARKAPSTWLKRAASWREPRRWASG